MDNMVHSAASVTVQVLRSSGKNPPRNPGDVDFEVKYPDGYTGPRYMPEGVTVVSREVAADLEKRGIGRVITPAEPVKEDQAPEVLHGEDEPVTVTEDPITPAEPVKGKGGKGKK